MTGRVVLDLGCCPAGSQPGTAVRRAGGKVLELATGPDAGPDAGPAVDVASTPGAADSLRLGAPPADPDGWEGRVARLLGLHAGAVAAGVPVPLADHVVTWARVRRELEADRWDVVVLAVAPYAVPALVEAPAVLLDVVDARLDALAPGAGTDPSAASQLVELLDLRPALVAARDLAEGAAAAGHPGQHQGCDRPGSTGLATVDRDDPAGPPVRSVRVEADGDGLVWSVALPRGLRPVLAHDGRRLRVGTGPARRTFRLPAALTRCEVRAARVVADRLEVRFEPHPDAWR
ncbi:hypothetical protein [Aquipuribacter hungaricus]|uniref:ArsA HSP20-like domain-containing protein n=1 Tax=Aquipuribacter hungaricus TaxID=545624 RepID=A0ABV7WGB3_9MICO